MPDLFLFLIKVNIALVLFCLGYYLVLRKLTFYTLNRVYLLVAIVSSTVYPLIDFSDFAQRHQEIIAPVQNVVIIWKAPAQQFVERAAYWNWLEALFWTGVIILAMRLMSQLFSLYRIYSRSTVRQINGSKVRVVNADIGPFSFWKSIYLNPDNLSPTDLQNILQHEQIHVNEWHTLDILLTEISVIFYWFNPGIWMMKKAVRENIEFITDRKILQRGADSKAYQYSLLSITFNQPAPVAITNNFNFSTLKKRIMMMNAKKSSSINLTRYAFLVPVVLVCLFAFSLSKAEVVKTNPAFKTVTDAVKIVNGMVLNNDTVPADKSITGKTTIKKTINGTTITLTGADIKHYTFTIDSSSRERQKVIIKGEMDGKDDSVIVYTYGGKPLSRDQIAPAGSTFKTFDKTFESFPAGSLKDYQVSELKGLTFSTETDTSKNTKKAFGLTTTRNAFSIGIVDIKPVTTYTSKQTGSNTNKLTEVTVVGRPTATKSTDKLTEVTVVGRPMATKSTDKLTEVTVVGRPIASNIYKGSDDTGNKVTTTKNYIYSRYAGKPDSSDLLNKAYKVLPGTPVQESNGLWHLVTTDPNGKQVTPVQPLYVVDGKAVNQEDLKSFEGNVVYLTPETAIMTYGKRGENGALIITTKKTKK